MEMTQAHIRYLLAVYGQMRSGAEVGTAGVARAVGVSGASASRMLRVLMEQGLVVRRRYGKIYLTDQGFLLARGYDRCAAALEKRLGGLGLGLTEEEAAELAAILAVSLPERIRRTLDKEAEAER